jgi:translation elongation factor EF-4
MGNFIENYFGIKSAFYFYLPHCLLPQFIPMYIVFRYFEPMSLVSIVTPAEHFAQIDALCEVARGERVETKYLDEKSMLLKWRLPLVEVIVDFFDNLRRISSGYASFDLRDDGVCVFVITIFINFHPKLEDHYHRSSLIKS